MKKYSIYIFLLLLASSATYGQSLTKDQLQFLKKNSANVCTDTNFSRANWKAVTPHLQHKSIILLGEFNHGAKEIFEIRNSLVKYLHKEMGINTILFESGIGELITADIKKNEMSAKEMTYGLFGGWRTKEFTDLMDYVKSENISIAGFDVQRSGGSFAYLLKEITQKKNIDSTLYVDLETRYGSLNKELTGKKAIYDSLKTKTEKLIHDYRKISDELSKHTVKDPSAELLLTIMTLENRVTYLTYMLQFIKDKNWNNRWAARDSAMAHNLEWLITTKYKNEPVMVIAHNFHISRFNEKENVMGEMLSAKYGTEMYSMGIFAGSGSFSDNSGKVQQMLPPDSAALDIKHIVANLPATVNYIHIPENKKTGSDWLDNGIIVNDTFIDLGNGNTLVLSKSFDGILVIDKISPAH